MLEWLQSSWPQVQTISVLSAIPSQCAPQYFSLLGARQLQAGFAHFLGVVAIYIPFVRARETNRVCRISMHDSAKEIACGQANP